MLVDEIKSLGHLENFRKFRFLFDEKEKASTLKFLQVSLFSKGVPQGVIVLVHLLIKWIEQMHNYQLIVNSVGGMSTKKKKNRNKVIPRQ